jgi:DHA2 family multidrug resistance protein
MAREPGAVNPWLVAAAVLVPTVMEVLDTSIVNVALPHMAGSLGADTSESTWVLTSYLVANAIVLPMTSWLSRLFGRRNFLLGCVALFTVASVLSATAETLTAMVAYRALQGAAGGALQPLSQAILLESFPEEERGGAMAVWGMGIVVAPVVAPLIGGWLTDNYTWHWIFLINVPIGVLGFLAISAFVSDPPHARPAPVRGDAIGIGLLVVGMASLQVVLDKGQEWGWWGSEPVRVLGATAVGCLALLVWHELRTRNGIIDLRVLRDRSFSLGTGLIWVFGFTLYATLTLIPLYTQTLLGYSALQAGIVMSPRGLAVMATMGLAGLLLRRVDPRWVMLCGVPFLVGSSYAMGRFTAETGSATLIGTMLVQGLGMGFLFVPLATASMARIPAARMSAATGLFNLMRNVGGSIGVSVTQTLIARAEQMHHVELARFVNPYDPRYVALRDALAARFATAGLDLGAARRKALALVAAGIDRQAAILSYREAFLAIAAAFVLIVPLVLLMRPAPAEGRRQPMAVG